MSVLGSALAAAAAAAAVRGDVPVDPTAPDAQQWLINELAKPEYQAAKPTWLDQAATAVRDWLSSLVVPSGGNLGGLLPVIVALIVAGLVVAAFIVFGRPRRNRSAVVTLEPLFGVDDRRTAAQLRASAAAAAQAGDYTTAIEELYRALARRQSDRTVIRVSPGTTAQEFAGRASIAYPAQAGDLAQAARGFDGVRYLGASATREVYEHLVSLELALRDLAPTRLEPVAAGASR